MLRALPFTAIALLVGVEDAHAVNISASAQLYYTSNSQSRFGTTSGKAIFAGPTHRNQETNTHVSNANWASGTVVLGEFGDLEFTSSPVGLNSHEYRLAAVPRVAGPSLTGAQAVVHGVDGFNRPFTTTLGLPTSPGGFQRAQLFASVPPDNGSSSLDPSILYQQINLVESAFRNYQGIIRDIRSTNQAIVNEAVFVAEEELVTTALAKWLKRKAVALAVPGAREIALGAELFSIAHTAGDRYGALAAAMDVNHVTTQELQSLGQSLLAANAVSDTLARKIFLPQSVVATAVSDGIGGSVAVIGGSSHQYRNNYRDVDSTGVSTVGTSTFTLSGPTVAGPISTRNHFTSSGDLIFADSTITLPQGVLFRVGRRTSPVVETKALREVVLPDGTTVMQEVVIATDFNAEFTFSVRRENPGSFGHEPPPQPGQPGGIPGGLSATGNVSYVTNTDGRNVLLMTESSPASLSTAITLPVTNSAMVLDFRWRGQQPLTENAEFVVDFISSGIERPIFSAVASDEILHNDHLLRITQHLPPELLGQTGVIRFRLLPSEVDGVTSQIEIGGFSTIDLGIAGDFNSDGFIDGDDLAKWRGAFGQTFGADADYDGDNDGNDFLAWQRTLGAGVPAAASSIAAPEPAAWLIGTFGLQLIMQSRGRMRRRRFKGA
jgi:hypothetical protein